MTVFVNRMTASNRGSPIEQWLSFICVTVLLLYYSRVWLMWTGVVKQKFGPARRRSAVRASGSYS
jgi:hypothetical protein